MFRVRKADQALSAIQPDAPIADVTQRTVVRRNKDVSPLPFAVPVTSRLDIVLHSFYAQQNKAHESTNRISGPCSKHGLLIELEWLPRNLSWEKLREQIVIVRL
jgi:hypothetical protein